MEANKLVKRTVYDIFPPAVDYTITEHGRSLEDVLKALHFWGLFHRQEVIGKKTALQFLEAAFLYRKNVTCCH